MTIKAVLFDWAGTMVDFGSRAPVAAMQRVFGGAGVLVSDATVRRYMGRAKREHVEAMLREEDVAARWRKVHGTAWTDADVDALMDALEPAMAAEAIATAELVPGARDAIAMLDDRGIRIGSTTGYTRTMMAGIVPRAAEQGYAPEAIVCAGEAAAGRPAPLMLWKALVEMGVWPAAAALAVDDATVGIEAGRHAGCWTVGVAASGNGMGLSLTDYEALDDGARAECLRTVAAEFAAVGADVVIPSVADLSQALAIIDARIGAGKRPGDEPCAFLLD
jgi:phosphonoacetaldehyde hydrolase